MRFIYWLDRRIKGAGAVTSRFSHRFVNVMLPLQSFLGWLAVVAAVVCLVAMVVYVGFERDSRDTLLLGGLIRGSQIVFLINLVFNLVFFFRHYRSSRGWLQMVIDGLLLVTLLPLLYPRPVHPWIPWLEHVLYAPVLTYTVLALYSAVQLGYAVMKVPGRRTNPSLLLTLSFLLFIIIGTLLLMLPKCTVHGIGFVDALFVSTSAVCITGLTPVDVHATFTPLGLTVLGLLIETGALGVMTYASFFAMFFTGNQSIFSQLLMRDVFYSKSMSSLVPTLLYILGFTLAVEAAGAVAVYLTIPPGLMMDTADKIVFSAFSSVSAFCNAGFTNLRDGMSNPALMHGNQLIYWVMSAIVVAGAIGFPILVNFRDVIVGWMRRLVRRGGVRTCHAYDMNTKVVLVTFSILFVVGAVAFFFLEADNTLRGMTLWERVSQSVFNSVTPRSAGFASVNPDGFLNVTLVMVMFLMWVGGGAQSTAGGIKVNTLAAICINLRAIVTGRERVTAFHRTIAPGSIRRANAIVALSILSFLAYSVVMLLLEPGLPARSVLFETLSALFTVGSSLGITPQLGTASKILLCTAMLLGRVGLVSLLTGVVGTSSRANVHYPTDNLIIN